MKKKTLFFCILTVLTFALVFVGCKKSSTATISITGLTAGTVDLNGASAATGVSVNPTITATFSAAVDAATATSDNIKLTEVYDNVTIPITVAASGSAVTITPNSKLANGAVYSLEFTTAVKGQGGELVEASIKRSFVTAGVFIPAGFTAYWNFDGNANDASGTYSATWAVDTHYVAGRNTSAGKAAKFNGTTTLIEIPNGDAMMLTSDLTLAFWMKSDTTAKRGQFVMGVSGWFGMQFEYEAGGTGWCKLAAQYSLSGGTTASQDLWFDGSGSTKDNGGWKGWTFCKDLVSNAGSGVNGLLSQTWAFIVCEYNHTTKVGTMYINGTKVKEQDFNLYGNTHPLYNATGFKWAGATGNNKFVFGFIQDKNSPTIPDSWADYTVTTNNHYQGLLDDVVLYKRVLSENEILYMFNSAK